MLEAGAGSSREIVAEAAARAAARRAMERLGSVRATFVLLFTTPHHREKFAALAAEVAAVTGAETLAGCSAGGVIAEGREHESGPAVAVLAVRGGDLEARGFLAPGGTFRETRRGLPSRLPASALALMFPDVRGEPPGESLRAMEEAFGFVPAVGGVTMDDPLRARSHKFGGGRVVDGGLAGAILAGSGTWLVAVTSGCRPVGRPYVVTKADGPLLREIGSRPAMEVMGTTLEEEFPDPETARGRAVCLGIALDPGKHPLVRGDFVIRSLSLPDPEDTALTAGEPVAVGETVQFHVLDRATAREDLAAQLVRLRVRLANARPRFGVYVNCASRGAALHGAAHHDAGEIHAALGEFPLVGCVSQAELAPVGRRNLVHQHAGVLALYA